MLANDHVDFDVRSERSLALLGENGAGKSTLVRLLYGLYRPDEGTIRNQRSGNALPIHRRMPSTPGLGSFHQHFMLVPSLTVVENVALGLPSSARRARSTSSAVENGLTACKQYGLKVDPRAYVWQLAVGEQQRVEIVKALYRGAASAHSG